MAATLTHKGKTVLPAERSVQAAPQKAISYQFSNLNAPDVFDLQAPDGTRLSGGVRALQITDLASGNSAVVGKVRNNVLGELVPPNQILYRDAFEGVQADVLLVWRHNFFAQDVVLRERLSLPVGMDPESSQFEVVTEINAGPEPQLRSNALDRGRGRVANSAVLDFGPLHMVPGTAFNVQAADAASLGGWHPAGRGTAVAKEWHTLPDRRRFLIESVSWTELVAGTRELALREANGETLVASSAGRSWPAPRERGQEAAEMLLASAAFDCRG